jgi:hypothetical protein
MIRSRSPLAPLKKGGDMSCLLKVPLFKGDLAHIPHPQLAHTRIEGVEVNHSRQ